jgi:class 3 adenylate cyclase/tetratricopeptide (TPR) repeat protein
VQCRQCQFENRESVRFCEECGAKLEQVCPACGAAVPPGRKFCGECGERLPANAAAPKPAARAPEAYTPKHLAERILTSRAALEGERKQVTVLFADLKGSMELLADRDPEQARAILDPVLERMMDAVHRYEGTVNQVMGDGIMALFGAPLAHEDHAVRACYAALRMQEALGQYADEVWRSQNVRIQMRVGLNSGEVVVRSIGSDLRMDYTAVGQTTHLAARMEQLATPGTVLPAPDTLRLAEGYVQVKALGPVQVKGLSVPVTVYELLGAGTARSRLQATAARGLTRFVGRDTEVETLRRALEQADRGHGQVVALVGEPGVGKSRLVWEFTHSHRTQGWLVLESRSVSYGKATPYLPVIDLLKSYCGIDATDDGRRLQEKLTSRLLRLDAGLGPMLPAIRSLLDVPVEDPAWHALEPPQRRQRTLDACKHLLLRESQVQPLLLVFEDLHWIDGETQAVLDSLVGSLPTARLLLLVNYRPEYQHQWGSKTYYQQVRLDPLSPESADELLQALVGDEPAPAPLKRLLVTRTEGNPFFLEESVRTLVETGMLIGKRGAYHLANPVASTQLPATVQAVLTARIDRLASEDKRLLQTASVIGKDVPYPLLQAITERSEPDLRAGLTRLQAAEFLYETGLFPEPEHTFKHALTHEVAYGSLLQERRRALHGRIVAAIETLYADRLPEQAERLTEHALRAELWEKAVRYGEQAGRRADQRSAHREAAAYFEQAIAALGHLPMDRAVEERLIDLHFAVRSVLVAISDQRRTFDHLRQAAVLAERLDDRRRLARVHAYMARSYWLAGDHAQAVEPGERALAFALASGDLGLQVSVRLYLGSAYHALANYHRAADLLASNVAALVGDHLYERFGGTGLPAVTSRVFLAWSLAELGKVGEAFALAEEAVQIAESHGHRFSSVAGHWGVADLYLAIGDATKTIAVLEPSVEVCRTHGPIWFPGVAATLGLAHSRAGRAAPGLALLEEARDSAVHTADLLYQPGRLAALGEAYLLAGRRDDARATAQQALTLARAQHERGNEGRALHLLGEIAGSDQPPVLVHAEGYFQEALALAEELGMRPLVAHCHLGLGTLYRKVGDHEQAKVELATAAELYRAMEMPFWLAKAEAALAGAGAS